MRATYADLVAEVRAQVDVDPTIARAWLMDRSRVLNAETAWNLAVVQMPAVDGQRYYPMADDVLWIEALLVGESPYQRSTLHQMDARWSANTGNMMGIYADGVDSDGNNNVQIHPPISGAVIEIRYVADLADDLTVPPFPQDFDQALVDGAISVGLARMDERFDSAGYFDARFQTAVTRLKRRRHGHVGRGAVGIRVVM